MTDKRKPVEPAPDVWDPRVDAIKRQQEEDVKKMRKERDKQSKDA